MRHLRSKGQLLTVVKFSTQCKLQRELLFADQLLLMHEAAD